MKRNKGDEEAGRAVLGAVIEAGTDPQTIDQFNRAARELRERYKGRRLMKHTPTATEILDRAREALTEGKISLEHAGIIERRVNRGAELPPVLAKAIGIPARELRKAANSSTVAKRPAGSSGDTISAVQVHAGKVPYDPQAGGYRFYNPSLQAEQIATPGEIADGCTDALQKGRFDLQTAELVTAMAKRGRALEAGVLRKAMQY